MTCRLCPLGFAGYRKDLRFSPQVRWFMFGGCYFAMLSIGIIRCSYGVSFHMIHGPPFRHSVGTVSKDFMLGTRIIRWAPNPVTQSASVVFLEAKGSELLTAASPPPAYKQFQFDYNSAWFCSVPAFCRGIVFNISITSFLQG